MPQLSGTMYGSSKGANESTRGTNITVMKEGVLVAKGARNTYVREPNNGSKYRIG